MNVSQLIGILSEMDGEAEVLMATQPGYPLQFEVLGVTSSVSLSAEEECLAHDLKSCESDSCTRPNQVWIVEGGQPDHPYTTAEIWEQAQQ